MLVKKFFVLITAVALLLCGCDHGDIPAETTGSTTQTTTEITTIATEETKEEQNPIADEDFASVQITDKALARVGDTEQLTAAWENAAWRSSKPSVASVSADGTVTANSPGVALILVKNTADGRMYALAYVVIAKDENLDFSISETRLYKVGDKEILQVDIANPTLISSNEQVVKPAGGLEIDFVGAGIASITATSASVPRFFYYLVYDRTVEKG